MFKNISNEDILYYIDHYKPFDKAGSYGAQECLPEEYSPCTLEEKLFLSGIKKENLCSKIHIENSKRVIPFIDRIDGSYFNVMGLPLVELVEAIEKF
jgi:predicted house-cleaning NTP pyrophosphatase (Maf/HAM1 superfamily)